MIIIFVKFSLFYVFYPLEQKTQRIGSVGTSIQHYINLCIKLSKFGYFHFWAQKIQHAAVHIHKGLWMIT
jgi:hypothetical protein